MECRFFARGQCRNGASCRFAHSGGGGGGGEHPVPSHKRQKRVTLPESDFVAEVEWPLGPDLPTLEAEAEMRAVLVLNDQEAGRAVDLPLERRQSIAAAATTRSFSLPAAFSLRRQFLRQLTRGEANTFYENLNMGDASAAKDHAEAFELLVKQWLDDNGIPHVTEKELFERGMSNTPDFLLLGNVKINGTRVKWLDCKSYYGSALLCRDSRLPIGKLTTQARRYNDAYGESGGFIFLAGMGRELEMELRKTIGGGEVPVLLLNAFPLDTSSIYTELPI